MERGASDFGIFETRFDIAFGFALLISYRGWLSTVTRLWQ